MITRPMLAAPTDGIGLVWPKLASPKLDGVRCRIIDGVAMSRSMKPIPNKSAQLLFGRKDLNGLDGELIVGCPTAENVFATTSSGVMSYDGKPDLWFHVFDDFTEVGGFQQRLRTAFCRIKKSLLCVPVFHTEVASDVALLDYESECLASGYEGVMLRDPNGLYKQGRSTTREGLLLKLKRFTDAEAEVIGFTEMMHNTNEAKVNELGALSRSHRKAGMVGSNTLGSLIVRDTATGVEFEVGTGFSESDRFSLWSQRHQLIGKLAKYKSQPTGVKDKPRFPVFLGFRDLMDL